MADVTRILSAIEAGDPRAADELLPLVYDELRRLAAARLAAEKSGHTLQAAALVHEAYLRLVGSQDPGWNGRLTVALLDLREDPGDVVHAGPLRRGRGPSEEPGGRRRLS